MLSGPRQVCPNVRLDAASLIFECRFGARQRACGVRYWSLHTTGAHRARAPSPTTMGWVGGGGGTGFGTGPHLWLQEPTCLSCGWTVTARARTSATK